MALRAGRNLFCTVFSEFPESGLQIDLWGHTSEHRGWCQNVYFLTQIYLQFRFSLFGAFCVSYVKESSFEMILMKSTVSVNHSPYIGYIYCNLHHFLIHFLDVSLAKSKIMWKSSLTNCHSSSYYDFGNGSNWARSQLLREKKMVT